MAFWPALLSKPTRTSLTDRPSLTLFFLLVGAFFLTFVPHVEQLPLWVSFSVTGSLLIRSILEYYRLPLPSNAFCNILALCLVAGIIFQFNTMLGREAGTAFMAGLLAIKFFELRGPRDISVIIFSSFFVVMSALLYSQALELFIYCLIMMWVLTSLLLRNQIGDASEDHLLQMLGRSGLIFLQALPLTIFLFFFFPRFEGKLQVSLNESPLGLTDTVQPGSIAKLARDDSEAFYAKLTGDAIPTVDTMYWRALVLWEYHKGTWTPGRMAEMQGKRPLPRAHSGPPILQTIVIYPHFKPWLFALDQPVSEAENRMQTDRWSSLKNDAVIQLTDPREVVDRKEEYTVTSALELEPQVLTPMEREAGLQLGDPKDDPTDRIDPDVRKLADQIHAENPDEQAYISNLIHYFRHNGIHYDASPGTTPKGEDWLHDFLFRRKVGFCEHFASAFAVMMRLEKIPARLVVGYQGALFNPYDNTYIVKQSNAHAWDEVWIDAIDPGTKEPKGWVRYDPTALIAAGEGGPSADAGNPGGSQEEDEDLSIQIAHHRLTLVSGAYLPEWMRRSLLDLQLRRQQLEANWDDWVFSYDPDAQNRLAQALGMGRDPRVMMGLACLVATGICLLIFQNWLSRKPPISPVETLYAAFCRSMSQRGVPRAVWEGPLAYTERTAEAFPDRKGEIESVGRIVAQARYGPEPTKSSAPEELESLLTLIAAPPAASSSRASHGSG
jgi:transglutaminase-like putative cysteine protease